MKKEHYIKTLKIKLKACENLIKKLKLEIREAEKPRPPKHADWRLVLNIKTKKWVADKKAIGKNLAERFLEQKVYVPAEFSKKQVEKQFNKPVYLTKKQLI